MKKIFEQLRIKKPLIHNITNYVTVNDVANMLLASGASPIMADDEQEVEDITALSDGLNINMGTLSKAKVTAMKKAGIKANALHHPVVLDPVGIGASQWRKQNTLSLCQQIHFDVIRGNMSEIRILVQHQGKIHGVDASEDDIINEDNLKRYIATVKSWALQMKTIIAVTGAIDLVSDGKKCFVIKNGTAQMQQVTGTGCQLSALICAFITANPQNKLEATAAAVCTMGLAGEIAKEHLLPYEGNATFRNRMIDAVSLMDGDILERGAKYEIR